MSFVVRDNQQNSRFFYLQTFYEDQSDDFSMLSVIIKIFMHSLHTCWLIDWLKIFITSVRSFLLPLFPRSTSESARCGWTKCFKYALRRRRWTRRPTCRAPRAATSSIYASFSHAGGLPSPVRSGSSPLGQRRWAMCFVDVMLFTDRMTSHNSAGSCCTAPRQSDGLPFPHLTAGAR